MLKITAIVLTSVVSVSGMIADPVWGASRIERSGTVGLGVAGVYGGVRGNARFGTDYDDGPGLSLTVRYVVGPHWSVGLNFQSQTYNSVANALAAGFDKIRMTNVSLDTYFYRDRTQDASQYLVAGFGFYRPEIHLQNNETAFPRENLVLSLGLGAEVFVKENWGFELSARALGYFGDGYTDQERADVTLERATDTFSLGFQGQIGILYYLLR